MVYLIGYLIYLFAEKDFTIGTRCAPSILITFINMVLNKQTPFEEKCGSATMYSGQLGLQKFLFFVAIICVPWMLLAKPIYIMRSRKNSHHSVSNNNIFKRRILGNSLLRSLKFSVSNENPCSLNHRHRI